MMNNSGAIHYEEISKARVTDTRNVVISKCSRGGFTIAQQLEAKEAGTVTSVFMKNAIRVDSIERLIDLRDAINMAISIAEESHDDVIEEDDWDD